MALRLEADLVLIQKIHHRAILELILLDILERDRKPRLALLPNCRRNPAPLDLPPEFLFGSRVVVIELKMARRIEVGRLALVERNHFPVVVGRLVAELLRTEMVDADL